MNTDEVVVSSLYVIGFDLHKTSPEYNKIEGFLDKYVFDKSWSEIDSTWFGVSEKSITDIKKEIEDYLKQENIKGKFIISEISSPVETIGLEATEKHWFTTNRFMW